MSPLEIFKNDFPAFFVEFVHRLETDKAYRADIAASVKAMPLNAYYDSPVWKLTLRLKRKMDPRAACYHCKHPKPLQGHHKDGNYQHLGIEVLYLDDIELICDECHRDFHGIPDRRPQMRFQFPPQNPIARRVFVASCAAASLPSPAETTITLNLRPETEGILAQMATETNRSIAEVLAEAVEIEFNRRLPRQSRA